MFVGYGGQAYANSGNLDGICEICTFQFRRPGRARGILEMPRSTLVGEDPCIPLALPWDFKGLSRRGITATLTWQAEESTHLRPTFPPALLVITGMHFLLALQAHMSLEVVLALKIGFAEILHGPSALARADAWICAL